MLLVAQLTACKLWMMIPRGLTLDNPVVHMGLALDIDRARKVLAGQVLFSHLLLSGVGEGIAERTTCILGLKQVPVTRWTEDTLLL